MVYGALAFESTVGSDGARLVLRGKLCGSAARRLGLELARLHEEGIRRVVLDMRSLWSLDSLAIRALEESVARGLHITAVVRPGFRFDDFVRTPQLPGRGLALRTAAESVRHATASA
jgi:hypothetical protein